MSPEEICKNLVEAHFDILQRDREIKEELVEVLVEQKMTDFFSINWRKLNSTFVRGRR